MHPRPLAAAIASLAMLSASLSAQDLDLDKIGGAVGGPLTCPIRGEANEPYVLLFDLIEQQTTFPALGITLAISDRFAYVSFNQPTFFAMTDGNGEATASTTLPNDASLQGLTFSLQAVAGSGPFRVSNLIRVTPQLSGTFLPTLEAPVLPLAGGGAVAQDDGEWLLVGGSGPLAQRYRSRTEQWQPAGATFGVGLFAQTTTLADGRVLFTGGLDLATGQPSAAAAIYDPATQQTTTLAMNAPRAGHGASQLGNGQVLITGGSQSLDLNNPLSLLTGILSSTELFDPATGTFTNGPTLLEPRAFHTSTTLGNGRVLIAGGITLLPIVNVPTVSATAYLFNPATNGFGLPSFFSGARFLHTATPLSDGKVLLAGGLSLDLTTFLQTGNLADLVIGTRDDCQLFSQGLLFNTFATVGGMQVGRAGAGLAPLPGGGALIVGGFQLTIDPSNQTFALGATAAADVFAQGPNAITPTGDMNAPRLFPIAVPLSDGTVLVAGGSASSSEVYQR